MYKVIAFDAFGTLCRITDRRNPYGSLFRRLGVEKAKARTLALTKPVGLAGLASLLVSSPSPVEAADKVSPNLSEILEPLEADLAAEVASIQAFPEAIDTIKKLKEMGFRIVVVSNLAEPYGAAIRQLFGALVDGFVFSFEVQAVKPDPAIFETLCQSLSVKPEEVLLIGDSRANDFEGAATFGMSSLHLLRTGPASEPRTIPDLLGIFNYLT